MDPAHLRIGIDLGGTKIAGIVLDAGGAVRAEGRIPTPRDDYDATLDAIVSLVLRMEREAGGIGSVGIGMPGAVSPRSGLVKNANSVWLNGRPFVIDLEARLGRPVRAENDANCLAVSEAVDGAGAGARVVWAIILGTGVGSGIAIDGGGPVWRQPHRGRMGAQSTSRAPRRRTARTRLLLRPAGLYRDVALRAGVRRRPWQADRSGRPDGRIRHCRRAGGAMQPHAKASLAIGKGSPARWPA